MDKMVAENPQSQISSITLTILTLKNAHVLHWMIIAQLFIIQNL